MNQSEFTDITDWKYFTLSETWSSHGRPSNRTSRSLGFTSAKITLTYWLSGVVLVGTVETGNYSKAEMGKAKSQLKEYLVKEMYSVLARNLSLAGFSRPYNEESRFKIVQEKETLESCLEFCKRAHIDEVMVRKYYGK